MPFDSLNDLPEAVKEKYPSRKAREAFRAAFNSAYDGTCKEGGRQGDREGCSFAVAHRAAQRVNKAEETSGPLAGFFKALSELVAGEREGMEKIVEEELAAKSQEIAKASSTSGALSGAQEKGQRFDRYVEICKADHERQVVWGIVLEPDEVDLDGDVIDEVEIGKSIHRFLSDYSRGRSELGVEHTFTLDRRVASVVECYQAPVAFRLGKAQVKKGSWVVAVHIADATLWKAVKAGEFTGFSLGGFGLRQELAVA